MNRANLAPTFYFYVLFRVWPDTWVKQCDKINFAKLDISTYIYIYFLHIYIHICILIVIHDYILKQSDTIFTYTENIFSSLFMTISSRRPNGVYIRGGRSINPWFRSADNKLLLIKCSSTYKLKPQFMSRETNINISNQKKRVERTFRRRSG